MDLRYAVESADPIYSTYDFVLYTQLEVPVRSKQAFFLNYA